METKEFEFKGFKISGFIALFLILAVIVADIFILRSAAASANPERIFGLTIPISFLLIILLAIGMVKLEPNEARALVFFGKYRGTLRENGFWYINPLLSKKRVSLRARNFDAEAIKVNDKSGNPILIGLVLVWRVKDVYKSLFEIDSQTMSNQGSLSSTMKAFESFVKVQADAALRQVAGRYNYDENSNPNENDVTLRSGADEINDELTDTLNERLSIAGIEAIEARINYLAYAPEIAAVMLRRQQADAIIAAR
ncbi:MAG: SPFH domain-containing protein, partial [Bacteroidales bacterium]|nr:SPFH domain-containing protein [Bacteroidales bacterium]